MIGPNSFQDHFIFIKNVYKCMEIERTTSLHEKTPSKAWYLLPIFFGVIGGLIMFFVLKDEDGRMAKKGAVVGIILTVVYTGVAVVAPIILMFSLGS